MNVSLTSLFAAGLLLAATPALAGLDFTLQHKRLPADGISVDSVYITDGPSKIYLRVEPEWKLFNNAQSLECVPDKPDAKIRLEAYPGSKVLPIDQGGGSELVRQATSQLPSEAKNVVTLPVELNPLPLFHWSTMEVTFRYTYFDQPVRRSVMYLSMIPGRVVQLTVVAPDADFDKIHKIGRQLVSSWFEPSRDLPPDLQRKYESPDLGNPDT